MYKVLVGMSWVKSKNKEVRFEVGDIIKPKDVSKELINLGLEHKLIKEI